MAWQETSPCTDSSRITHSASQPQLEP
ncbi:hypothetical protein E2C01_101607 [Portunus trituberculatus]|uniref:Uncharacterized protein n=1 Tax=Portunus trituberculatus TaxID=210409 RepID=A0A5B7KKJ2_PORTR|nr:hypothetical protein [Portunus trituberculatus]